MSLAIIFLALISTVLAHQNGIEVTLDDVSYHFYPPGRIMWTKQIVNNNVSQLSKSLQVDRSVIFIIGGYGFSESVTFESVLSTALGSNHEVNVFYVDWSKYSNGRSPSQARKVIYDIGSIVGQFINLLAADYSIPFDNFTLIGFDLGAHVAGNAGKNTLGKVSQIFGLDPAKIDVDWDRNDFLGRSDAQYVQVVHTNAGATGMAGSLGHADFYANDGVHQPGCWRIIGSRCHHLRAIDLYVESIKNDSSTFWATRCINYKEFSRGHCADQLNTGLMGGLFIEDKVRGNYFLQTNSRKPFSRGRQ